MTADKHLPDEFNVIIAIPMNADPIKYEVDENSGALFSHWRSIADVPEIRLRQIQHFFEHYKDLEAKQMSQADRLGRACRSAPGSDE